MTFYFILFLALKPFPFLTMAELPWKNSQAKELLQQDIIAGIVQPTMDPKQVYTTQPEYSSFPYAKFHPKLKRLQDVVNKLHRRMGVD